MRPTSRARAWTVIGQRLEDRTYSEPAAITRTLTVDLTAPTAPGYTAPVALKVGVAINAMNPSGGVDVSQYGAAGLPSGLILNTGSGVINGTPDAADANPATARVTVGDTAGNTATTTLRFPAVAKGDQALTGFQYSASSVAFGSTAPTVTAPAGVQTTLGYSATPAGVCAVDPSSGALTLAGAGDCEITATAAASSDYNEATASYTITVETIGTLVLNLRVIAGDNTVNIAEKTAGFDHRRRHRDRKRRRGDGAGRHRDSHRDLGGRRGDSRLVGERAGGRVVHHRHKRGRIGERVEVGLHRARRDHPHADRGSHRADGAGLYRARGLEGGCGHHPHESNRRRRHR